VRSQRALGVLRFKEWCQPIAAVSVLFDDPFQPGDLLFVLFDSSLRPRDVL
jgi:hypothetical protein